jgi:16S rRNA processing protein RimM
VKEFYLIAKTKSNFNKNGFVFIQPYSDSAIAFEELTSVYIFLFGDYRELKVDEINVFNENVSIKIRNFEKEKELKYLLDKELFVDSSQLLNLPTQINNVLNLIGSKVYRNSEFFGLVKNVIRLASNDVLVIETGEKEELLIPLVEDYVIETDYGKKRIVLKPGTDSFYYDEN